MTEKKLNMIHIVCLISGLTLFLYSVISAVIFHNDRFYSSFALGSFLLLSCINYRLNRESTVKFFLFEASRRTKSMFILISTASFFAVDYYYGVQLSGMWNWIGYGFVDYIFMFAFMNIAFILSMYELYRIIFHILAGYIPDKNYLNFNPEKNISGTILVFGVIFLLLPMYVNVFQRNNFIEYAMIFPFFGILLLADRMSLRINRGSVLGKIFSLNMLYIVSFFLTSLFASAATEGVNLFGREWEYVRMPFGDLKISEVPIAVFIGWIPLVLAVISIVNMVKNMNSDQADH